MTALVKRQSRGTIFAQTVSAAFVAMSGLLSIDISGEKVETYDSTTLDDASIGATSGATAAYKTKDPTGYVEPATIKLSGFYDPVHATYTNLYSFIQNPVPTAFKVTYTDSAPTSATYSVTGASLDKKVDPGKGVVADIELVTSGAPT